MHNQQMMAGRPYPMGAYADEGGVNFAVFSAHAAQIDLCLFTADGARQVAQITLPERTGDIWHGYLEGLQPGAVYGYRAHGCYAPNEGHRFNPNKLLLDPYTITFCGDFTSHPATLGYIEDDPHEDLSFDPRDSAPFVAKSVVPDPALRRPLTTHCRHAWTDTLIYEAHVKGLTQQHPDIPPGIAGTYDALASEPMLDHLQRLGVTTIELLPVHAFLDDGFLLKKKLSNYWGYNTIGFFAPEPRYFGPRGVTGFQQMVARFHDAGIEVLLDVVYNHTAEGDQRGPTLAFRGLDNASYYRLQSENPRYYVNDTGTGNTLNVAHPHVLRMVTDSLRFWTECMGVDGFRFDLATSLAREENGFNPHGGFLDALRQDPVLAQAKLIAEPWDIGPGGYQLGGFPPEFGEWNDVYRDTLRRFWKGDAESAQDLGSALLGSAAVFDRGGRRPGSSIHFVTAHDGFTLADVTSYTSRHNAANLEDNRDGHAANHSDNCGVEGPTEDAAVLAKRLRRRRNLIATLFLSQGTPMLLAGDERGNSQAGNNNAYCQDNPIGWIDWRVTDAALDDFVSHLAALRRSYPVLRQDRFLHGAKRAADGAPDVAWFNAEAEPLDWGDPDLATVGVLYRGSAETRLDLKRSDAVYVVFNRAEGPLPLHVPPADPGMQWMVALDTSMDVQEPALLDGDAFWGVGPHVVAFVSTPVGDQNARG